LLVGGGKRMLNVLFLAKKAQNERWEVVVGQLISLQKRNICLGKQLANR
jgi:hypothetical protein